MAEQHPLDQVLESHSTDQRAPILRLPIDMIAEILANFDSTKSLLPVILAHSIFLEAFTTQQHRILQEILRRQIPARLLSLATVVQKTAHTDVGPSADGKPGPVTQNWDKIYHIMRHHRKPELLRPFKLIAPLTPTIAVAMEKTHSMVNFFMLAFIDRAVSNGNAIFGVPTAGIFATRRTYRLSQAFYRFQLYCNVFGNDPITLANRSPLPIPRDRARQSLETFFLAWNDRANTQLALSLVYLRGEILIMTAENWMAVAPIAVTAQTMVMPDSHVILMYGLPFLYKLSLTVDPNDRRALLETVELHGLRPGPIEISLGMNLNRFFRAWQV